MKYIVIQDNFVHYEHSLILWAHLQVIVKICGPEREDKGSLEHHINRKFMVNAYQGSEI